MSELKSEGKCVFCNEMHTQKGLNRHLSTHFKKMEKEVVTTKLAYHIYIPVGEMFLHLLVQESATLADLDGLLRKIWLECCGHLSSFMIKGKRYNDDFDSMEFGEKMKNKVSKVFQKGMKLKYTYDFGSSTDLEIEVKGEYKIKGEQKILLLSRNEPLEILCHSCQKKPAADICSVCIYDGPSMFCKTCAKKHAKTCEDFADYSKTSLVNSPRMGVCGYDGGQIDLKRDGVWKG